MKVSVLGAGAIGSMFGGLIQHHRPEVDVLFIGRGEHGRAVQDQGFVELEGPWGTHSVPVKISFEVEEIAGSDYVLFAVKSQSSEEAISAAKPYLGDATVISIQNGINDATLVPHVNLDKLVVGMTATNVAVLRPGSASLQLDGVTMVGPPEGADNFAVSQDAAQLLQKTGLRVVANRQMLGIRYNKLAINALGYASCLSQSNFITEAISFRPWRRHVGRPIVEECLRTFRVAQVTPLPIPGRPHISRMRQFLKLLDAPLVGSVSAWGARAKFNRKPIVFSLYQDLLRGKKTEVDYINGQIVRLAEANGLDAPYNRLVAEMVHHAEACDAGTFFSREEVIRRFRDVSGPAGGLREPKLV
jgi:2-dehydropantoate 2-reductase